MKIGKIVLNILGLGIVGSGIYFAKKSIDKSSEMKSRYKKYYEVTNQWIGNKNEQKNISDYFKNNDYNNIAIYGLGEMGTRLFEELKDTDINIKCFIDKNADEIYYGVDDIQVIGVNAISNLSDIDVIVVTPVYAFDSIEEELMDNGVNTDIVSLEDVVYEV